MSDTKTKERSMARVSKRHDGFLKQAMTHPKVSTEIIKRYVPEKILSQINLATLRQESTEFIAKNLKAYHSDVLFSVEWKNKQKGYLYFHCEHQSEVDQFITIRVLKYMVEIFEMHQKKYPKEKLAPLIYPTLIYTGKQKYTAPLSYAEILGDIEMAKECFPATKLNMIDVYRMQPEQIQADIKENRQFGMFFYAMKNIHAKDIFEAMKNVEPKLKDLGDEFQDLHFYLSLVYYVLTEAKNTVNKDKLITLFTKCVREQYKGEVMTIADQIRQEGEAIGIEKERIAIIKNMLENNMSIDIISTATKVSPNKIEELKKKLH